MAMAGERDGGVPDRATRAAAPAAGRRPSPATDAERARWRELGRDRFRDAGYQRWAQGHRSVESLRAAGRASFAETARRYGRAFAADLLARRRLVHPTEPERRMIGLLDDLGQREGVDYAREYPVVPGRLYAAFAWPERRLAIEVYGDAYSAEWFVERGILERDARRLAAYDEAGWSVRVVTGRDLRERRDATREQVRALLAE
jgi:very-short-patch-repair endonuclease